MDLNHRSTGYEPVGITMLTYPASTLSAIVSILEPTDNEITKKDGRFLDKDLLGSIDEEKFQSLSRDPSLTQRKSCRLPWWR